MPEWIPIAQPSFRGNEKKYLLDTVESGWISSIGYYIEQFEKTFASMHGVKHAIATHNGTIALHLALVAAGISEGDEVIVPDLTFIATANCVRYCHAIPVLVDVDPNDWNISVESLEAARTPKTKAIIPVHLYGNPAMMDSIMAWSQSHGVLVIEDCAEALGATIKGRKVGTFGHISCFSFFGNKVITTGEGGICLTNDDQLAERMRILRDHGMNRQKKYWYDQPGFNYRMTNMQAAVGLAQLEQLDQLLNIRDQIRMHYTSSLIHSNRIKYAETHGNRTINWIFTIRVDGFTFELRDRLMAMLREKGVYSRPVFYPIHLMSFYRDQKYIRTSLENSMAIAREGISLPTFADIKREQIEYIAIAFLDCIDTLIA